MNDATAAIVPDSIDDPRVKPVAREVATLTDQVNAFAVTDAESFEHGGETLKAIKAMAKNVDEQRKWITQPLDEAKRHVMDLFRPLTDQLTKAEGMLKRRLVTWQSEQERIAREAQRKAEEQARREQERLEKQAAEAEAKGRAERAETLRDRAAMTVAAPPAPPAPVAPKVSGLSTRSVWKFEIVDASKVPDEYKTIDEKKIGGVVRALKGDANIPGVRVYEEKALAARSA